MSPLEEILNNMDEGIAIIRHLAELRPVIDGNPELFHIPPDLVVTSRVIYDCLDISTCYPHRVLSGDETR
jgi:hypothetical protein